MSVTGKGSGAGGRARELIGFRRYAEAEALLRTALRREPESAALHALMGDALGFLGRAGEAEIHVREAARLAPGDWEIALTLGELLMATGRREEGVRELERALEASGGVARAYTLYATLMQDYWLLDRAVEVFERGLAAHPHDPDLLTGLAIVLMKSGRPEETVERIREGARRHPGHAVLASQRAFTLNYPPGVDPAEALEAHRAYGALLARAFPAAEHARPGAGEAGRRLRVGFVSADLRVHACASFFEAVIAGLDRKQFDTCCYSVAEKEDQRSAELRRHASMWRHAPGLEPRALAARIRDDRMDILIDLSGLTAGGRMEVFSLRPAPIQMTYLGYPNTTGIPAMDYRIVDSITDPPGAEQHATERLLRIDPCFLCYTGMDSARAEPAPPAQRDGARGVTFGSFNALQKVNDPLLRLWARVVREVPGSRLAVKYMSMGDQTTRERLRSRLHAAGLGDEQILLMEPKAAYRDHLESYGEIDIGLDTFPYNGTTTTCEALWMGVPVVTLAGRVHASRVGASLLSAVGLPDLVAGDEEEFVRLAAALAGDKARLVGLRAGLREKMLASPLCDRAAFGRRFGDALRGAWRAWCGMDAGSRT